MARSRRWWLAIAVAVVACTSAQAPTDGGAIDAHTSDGGTMRCHVDSDCSDGVYCNGVEHCLADGGGDAPGSDWRIIWPRRFP